MSNQVSTVEDHAPAAAQIMTLPPASNAGVRERAGKLRAERVAFVMATVVRAERPTSAKAGDVAIVLGDGTIEGFVGGECAEASVRLQSLRSLESRQPVLLHISPEGAGTSDETAPVDGSVTVHNPCLSGGKLEIFLEPNIPAPVMVVHGRSPIAAALARIAAQAGYVLAESLAGSDGEDSPAQGSRAEDPLPGKAVAGADAVVVASHGRDEEGLLVSAARANVAYIGLVASKKRGAAVLDRLGLPDEQRACIHTPAGLDLGARSPEEIAISILAEIISSRRTEMDETSSAVPCPADDDSATGTPPEKAMSVLDPVCRMTVIAGPSSPHADYQGELYFFCGSGCRDAFVADPEGFLARS